jgi:integrase/recombinase XerD
LHFSFMDTTSLFDSPDAWRRDPATAFAGFVMSPAFLALSKRKTVRRDASGNPLPPMPLRVSSAKIYIAMFGKFLRWLTLHQKSLLDLSSEDLMAFLDQGSAEGQKTLNSAIRAQYLGLFERVYAHLKVDPNPATHASFAIYRSGSRAQLGINEAKAILSAPQEAAFMGALPGPQNGERGDAGWKRRRDRAMQAMMLGAGLKVSEVIGIYTDNVGAKDSTGSMPIAVSPASAGGTVRAHQTQLRPFAVPEVLQWLAERRQLAIPGPLLFPATLSGGRLARATVYRQVKATFERAGINPGRHGGRTLRNAFAVRELGATDGNVELVGEFLGHRKRRSIDPYAAAANGAKDASKSCKT